MAGYMFAFKRSYLNLLISSGAGIAMLAVGVVLLIIGSVWVTRMAKLKV